MTSPVSPVVPPEHGPVPALEARGIVKNFGRVLALRGANFDVQTGEVVAGSLSDAVQTRDRWTFRRDVNSPNPNWVLIETDEDE